MREPSRRCGPGAERPGTAAARVLLALVLAVGSAAAFAPLPARAAPPADDGSEAAALARATFAGGCFWCVEQAFDGVEGVVETVSGFTGGHAPSPTYREVTAGGTGHYEAVEVRYDPARVDYRELLRVFWRNVDPTDASGQFCDRGPSYRTAVFVHDEDQRALAEASKREIEQRHDLEVVTPILSAGPFTAADASHQDYHLENPVRYELYKWNCGRAQRLEEIWGDEGP